MRTGSGSATPSCTGPALFAAEKSDVFSMPPDTVVTAYHATPVRAPAKSFVARVHTSNPAPAGSGAASFVTTYRSL